MTKFLAVIKREYLQRVRTKFFIVATVLGPVMLAMFTVLPVFIANIPVGGATRLAVVDQTGTVYERFREALTREDDEPEPNANSNSGMNANRREQMQRTAELSDAHFAVEQVRLDGRSLEETKRLLNERVRQNELDGYVVIPADVLNGRNVEFYGRNTGDIFTRQTVANALSRAVREQWLAENQIDQRVLRQASRRVNLNSTKISATGEERVGGGGFMFVFSFGMLIYISVMMYGQIVLGAVIEEKETRIAEILFSSMRSFPLMMGKLVGVSLVALTQLSIWGLALLVFAVFGTGLMTSGGATNLPSVPPIMFVYFVLYFLLGYFIYATVYALIGSMVTTTQEGGQLALPVVLMLVAGFYFVFPIIRSPNSSLAFWASLFPFLAPITMMVRITTETPPAWQIILSLTIGFVTVLGLIWLASRIYRVGMLMYGKKATIPEVMRWVRQA